MKERVSANSGVSSSTPAVDGENTTVCSTCPYVNTKSVYDKDEICRDVQSNMANYVDRYMDQIETAVYDDIQNEVNHRPAAQ